MSKPKIAVCTDFFGKYDAYSVSNVAFTEAQSFVELGYDVSMLVRRTYPESDEVPGIKFLKVMPHPTDISGVDPNFELPKDWKDKAVEAREVLQETLAPFDVAITHDWILQNATISWNWAMRRVMLPRLTWYHRLHSYPTGDPVPDDKRDELSELKCTMPGSGNHYLAWANNGHALWLAERYLTDLTKVKVVPLGVNWTEFFGMGKQTRYIVKQMDAFNATIVQCYAFCSSRMAHKGVHYLLQIMASFKQMGEKVKVILCNANSEHEGKERKEINDLASEAKSWGLNEFEDFCFTSRLKREFNAGVDRSTVADLQRISNVFVFPSETETYGLVALEAAATGSFLVLNEELVPLKEVGGLHAMYMPWDADHRNIKTTRHWMPSAREAMHQYARAIYPEISTNRILRQKMRVINEYDAINVARRYWEPLFYLHWSMPVDERGEAPEVVKLEEEVKDELVPGAKKEVEVLDAPFIPSLGLRVDDEKGAAPVEHKVEMKPVNQPEDITKPAVVEKAEWPAQDDCPKEVTPDEGPETNKIISVDLQNLPTVCPKENCEGEMIVLATGDKLGCKKCGHQIDSLGR